MQPMMISHKRGDVRWEWIGDAWKLFTENPGAWIGMTLISAVIALIAIFLPFFIFVVPAGMFATGNGGDAGLAGIAAMAGSVLIATLVIAIISLLVFSYLGAGLYRAAIQQAKGETISVGHLFSAGDSFLGVLRLAVLYVVASIVLGLALFSLIFVSQELYFLLTLAVRILQLVAAGFLFYCIPLIVDRKLGVVNAIRTSISTTSPQWWMYVLFVLVLTIIYVIGIIPCGLGLLVTIPMLFLASAAAYRDTFLRQGAPSHEMYPPPPPNYQAAPPRPQFSNPPQSQFPPQPQFSNPPEPTPLHSQETQLMGKVCPACGAALARTANFCNQCGSSL